jgi:hypothetical protein
LINIPDGSHALALEEETGIGELIPGAKLLKTVAAFSVGTKTVTVSAATVLAILWFILGRFDIWM